jgi:hypothetical protein
MKRQIQLPDLQSKWVPPDRLDRSRPRPVRLTGGGKAVLALAVVSLVGAVVAGIGLGVVADRGAENVRLFREEGVDADALVIRRWRIRGETGRTLVAYRFTVAGRAYEAESRIPRRIWQSLRVGSLLPVRYVRSNPDLNYPLGYGRRSTPLWLPYGVGAVLAVCGLLFPLPLLNQRRLLANGRVALAHVTSYGAELHGTHGVKLGKKFKYEFGLLSGATGKGESGPSKNPPAIGGTIWVLYDPETPRKNAPYPLSLVKVRRIS